MSKPTHHMVLRLAPEVWQGSGRVDVLKEHNAVVTRHGFVAVGKFGAAPKGAVSVLDELLQEGGRANLYLVHREGDFFRAVCAPLRWVGVGRLPERYRNGIPPYYGEIAVAPSTWFVVGEPFKAAGLAHLKLASNGRDLIAVLSECRTAAMLVERSAEATKKAAR